MKILNSIIVAAMLGAPIGATATKKVHTIGDSTMQTYDESKTVTRGWGQYLQQFFDGIEVNNRGKAGASSKSFYEETAFWASVKKQLSPGDYVVIQFAHNDEKNQGMDGTELKNYYASIGDTESAAAVDYRGTVPTTTYKEYLRKYVTETREAGCTPILCGAICRMYFSGTTAIRRNGRHDLGDSFSVLSSDGVSTGQKVDADDHSMDYVYQMQEVAKEMDVPFVDLTTATADLYLNYGEKDCMAILSDGDGSTHLSASGAALIARRFAQLCKEAGLMSEYVSLTSELSVTPADADLGAGYKGQTMTKEFMLSGFDLVPAAGNVTLTASGKLQLSSDNINWSSSLEIPYEGGTVIERFYVAMPLEDEGEIRETVTIEAGGKKSEIPVTATAVTLSGGQEVSAYWRLESDNACTTSGPIEYIPQSFQGMVIQRYSNPNANTTWPEWTGYEATRKTQRNLIEGEVWPTGEIDEVSTRYIEFGVKAMENTTLKIDEISLFLCGCGGNGMCVKVYYSIDEDFANPQLIYNQTKLPANSMQYIKETPVVSLESGQALRLRFYPWYNGTATGKTLCLSDITIHGYAMDSSDDSSITNVAELQKPVKTEYHSLDGISVKEPANGLYIVTNHYTDGQ